MVSIYFAFGISFRSNVPLPGLMQAQNPQSGPIVELHMGMLPAANCNSSDREAIWYTSTILDSQGEPALRIWKSACGDFLRLAYGDGKQFWIDRNSSHIWAVWPETSSLEDAATYLFGPVLGILLRLRGEICLHASAVALGSRVAVLAGPAGAGKSTIAAALARQGHPVISDDIVRLVERESAFFVQPAVPHVALWPESVDFLFGSADALPRFSAEWEKRDLALGDYGTQFERGRLPLGVVYVLGDRAPYSAPSVVELSPQITLMALVAHSYGTRILDREMRAKEFEFLGRLASRVPVRQLISHDDLSHLDRLCQVVEEDFRKEIDQKPAAF